MSTMQDKLRFLILTTALAAAACGNDDGGDLRDGGTPDGAGSPDAACDNVQPTFTWLHTNVLSTRACSQPSCHDNGAVGGVAGNLNFSAGKQSAYDELLVEASLETAAGLPNRVVAGNPQSSFMYRKINEADPPGIGGQMPLACNVLNSCLPMCQRDAIQAWIQAGAMND